MFLLKLQSHLDDLSTVSACGHSANAIPASASNYPPGCQPPVLVAIAALLAGL